MKKIIIIFILLCSSICASAFEKQKIYIFHVNGVNTTMYDALMNLKRLREISNIRSNIISWNVIYNPTNGLLASDLWDVFRQKRQENKDLTIDDYVAVYMKAKNLNYEVGSPEYTALKNQIKDSYTKDIGFVGCNFDVIVKEFHEEITNSYRNISNALKSQNSLKNTFVLLVPHSQGNLYANSLRNYLVDAESFPQNNIGIYGIASPADRVDSSLYPFDNFIIGDKSDGRVQYITADNDFVINSLRIFSMFLPASNQPLISNIHLRTCDDYDVCHNLLGAYLADENSATYISKKINLFIISLQEQLAKSFDKTQIVYRDYEEPVSLLDPNNNTVCRAGVCDEKIMGYIYMDSGYFKQYADGMQNLIFNFPSQLISGTYSIILDKPKNSLKPISIWSNLIAEAYGYYISPGCWYNNQYAKCFSERRSMIQYPGHAVFFNLAGNDISFCSKLPEVCRDNKFILGKFVLSNIGLLKTDWVGH